LLRPHEESCCPPKVLKGSIGVSLHSWTKGLLSEGVGINKIARDSSLS
jgi:hypothetical protein